VASVDVSGELRVWAVSEGEGDDDKLTAQILLAVSQGAGTATARQHRIAWDVSSPVPRLAVTSPVGDGNSVLLISIGDAAAGAQDKGPAGEPLGECGDDVFWVLFCFFVFAFGRFWGDSLSGRIGIKNHTPFPPQWSSTRTLRTRVLSRSVGIPVKSPASRSARIPRGQ
jgi:hypothetical protein